LKYFAAILTQLFVLAAYALEAMMLL